MAVVTRYRARGARVYYVKVTWQAKDVWERIGGDRRAARSRNAQVLREIREGVYQPKTRRDLTFREWSAQVAKLRTDRSSDEDQRVLANHVLSREWFAGKRLSDFEGLVGTVHIRQLLEELKATISEETKQSLSPKYVANIYGITRGIFKRATRRGLIDRDPCDGLERREVPRRGKRRRGVYAIEEIRKLCTTEAVTPSARVFCALAFLTGAREGELCGLRWLDLDRFSRPLWALNVKRQYDGQLLKTEKEHEGEKDRKVPVHNALGSVLEWWWEHGFELVHGRPPMPSDPIVPSKRGEHHTRSSAYKLWRKACTVAGVENRTLHATRHTFTTLCKRGGADKDWLERVTHNARGEILDQYIHTQWTPLCRAVLCLRLVEEEMVIEPVTMHESEAKLLVEALGIEERSPVVTSGNDSDHVSRDTSAEHLKNKQIVQFSDAQWDARHQSANAIDAMHRALTAIHGPVPA